MLQCKSFSLQYIKGRLAFPPATFCFIQTNKKNADFCSAYPLFEVVGNLCCRISIRNPRVRIYRNNVYTPMNIYHLLVFEQQNWNFLRFKESITSVSKRLCDKCQRHVSLNMSRNLTVASFRKRDASLPSPSVDLDMFPYLTSVGDVFAVLCCKITKNFWYLQIKVRFLRKILGIRKGFEGTDLAARAHLENPNISDGSGLKRFLIH